MRKAYILKRLTKQVKRFAALMLITVMAVGNVFADQVTFVFSEQGYENGEAITAGTINDYISFTADIGGASNAPKYYNTGAAIRFYPKSGNGNTMTLIPATGYMITSVVVNENSGNTGEIGFIVDGGEAVVSAVVGDACSISGINAVSSVVFYNAVNSTSGHIRIPSITITYSSATPPAVQAPVFSVPAGNYYTEQTVGLSCGTTGANIYYSINGADAVLYNAPFTINANATVTAFAVLGEDTSSVVTAQYAFPVFVSDIAAFYAAENAALFKITGDVTYVYRSGRYMYVKDATGGLLIFDNNNNPVITTEYNEGDVISGGVVGTRAVYNGLDELVPTLNTAEGVAGETVAPIVVTAAELLANPQNYVSQLVMVVDGEFAAGSFNTSSTTNVNFTQDGNTLVVRNGFKTVNKTFSAGDKATVVGFVTIYNSTVQLFPRDNNDIISTALPFTSTFDERYVNSVWTLVNGDNANKWYIGEAAGFDNEKLYISSSNGLTNKYNVSSASVSHAYVKVDLPASDVVLSFNCRTVGDANDYLQVTVMDEAPVSGTIPANSLTRIFGVNEFGVKNVLIPASYAGEKYIVFTWRNDANGGTQAPAAIDNVMMYSTCTTPTNVAATVNGQSATITWNASEGQDAWIVEYKDAAGDAWQTVNTTAPTVTLNNLSTEVTYDVRVRTNCGSNGVSSWAYGQFYVPCIQLTTSPMEITIGTGTSTTNIAPANAYYKNSWTQMIYPASSFSTPGYINSLSWYVNTANTHNYDYFKIYIGTKSSNIHANTSDWVPMEDLTLVYESYNGSLGTTSGWETYTLSTPYYYNGEDNLVIVTARTAQAYQSVQYRYTSLSNTVLYRRSDSSPESYGAHPGTNTGTTSSYLPNMKIDFTGYVCGDAVCAAPTDLSVDNVTTTSADLNWEAGNATAWKVNYKKAEADEWVTVNVTDNTYTLTDLAPNTNYMVRVMADCGTVGTSEEAAAAFTTVATCIAPQNLTATAVTHTVNVSWLPVDGINAYEVHVTGNNTDFTMNVQNASQTNISSLVEGATYTIAVRAICGQDETSDWSTINFIMPTICAVPTGLAVPNKGQNTATVTWNAGDASAWTVEYGYSGFTLGTGTQVNVNAPTVNLTGLNAYSTYDVYVKANCGLGYESNWSSKLSFTTECGPITITAQHPWTEGFESYSGSGNLAFDNCWATPEMSHYNSPFIYRNYTTTAHTGVNSTELKGDNGEISTLVLPAFTNPLADLQFSYFGMVTGTTPGTMQLGYVTDPTDASTFVEIQVIPAQSGSYNRANSLEYGPFFFTGITDPNARIALRFTSATSNCSWNLDDLMVRLLPNCIAPTNLAISAVTNNTATMGWTENGDATAWNIEYGPAGFTQGQGTVVAANTNPFTVTGLAAATTYDFYVQSNCGMGDLSEWTGSASATTKCDPILVTADNPWFEDFEGYQGSGEQPFLCWETPVKPNGPFVYCGYAQACHSGENSAEFKGSTNVLVLPAFVNNTYDLQVSFWGSRTSSSYGTMEVGYLTDLTDMTTFVPVATTPGPVTRNGVGTFMGTYLFPFSTPANARIALRYTSTSSTASWNLDDFTVSLAPSCRESSNLTIADVTTTSANVSWTPGGLETAWNLQYKASSADDWTSVNATSTTVALTSLASSTPYEVRVRPACADANMPWLTASFTTECANSVAADPMDFTIGTGTSGSNVAPMNAFYKNSWTQMIYPASAFSSAGYINTLSWEVSTANAHNFSTLKIYLGTTDKTTHSSTTDWVPLNDLTLVYSATNGTLGGSTGWETYNLTTPYYYNGDDNLVVVVSRSASSYKSVQYRYTSVTNAVLYRRSDNSGYDAFPGTSSGTRAANLPNMKVNFSGFTCNDEHCSAPTNVAVSNVTLNSATVTWDAGNATAWRVGYKAADASDWTSVDVTNNTYTITGLDAATAYNVRVKTLCTADESVYEVKSFNTACESCVYTFNLTDSYGDGWNGASIEVSFSGGSSESVTLSDGSTGTAQVEIPAGETMTLSWNIGSYDSETSFTITNGCNVVVFSGEGSTLSSNFFSAQCMGISCPAPTALTATDVENGSSTITWTAGGTETSWIITLTPNEGTAIIDTVSSPTYTVTGMQPGDSYNVSVKAVCGADDESDEVTTTVLNPALVDIALVDVYTNPSNCDLSNVIARITLKNMMESPITNFEAYYQVNGGTVVHESVWPYLSFNYGETYTYTFNTAPTFTDAANVITAWVTIPSETNVANNEGTSGVTYLTAEQALPYVETFPAASANNWAVLNNNADNSTFVVTNNALRFNGSDEVAANDWVISPCVDYTSNTTYLISFDYKANSPYYTEKLSAYYGPSINPYNNYLFGTLTFNNAEYAHFDYVEHMAMSMDNLHVAFKAESGVGTEGFTIDNVSVKKAVSMTVSTDGHGTATFLNTYFNNGHYYVGENEPATLQILSDLGYHVAGIYVNSVLVRGENPNNAAVDNFTFVPQDGDVVYVTFTENVYEVNATVGNFFYTAYMNNAPGAAYTPNHELVAHGGSHTGVITMAEHYHLMYVTVNGLDVTSDLVALGNNQYELTLTNIWEDKDIYVLAGLDSTTITYTVLAGEGTINNEFVVDGNTTLPAVYTVTLVGYADLLSTITPAPGYHVASIIIDGVEHSIIDIYSFEHLFGDHTVEVIFAPNHYVITTTGYGNGTVTPGVEFDYTPAYTYAFAATPATGYSIASVTRNGVNLPVADPMATFTDTLTNITSNYDYVATFVHSSYTIAATAGAHGTISPAGVSTYLYHQNAVYNITAAPGYYISGITVDGETTSYTQADALTATTYTFANIEDNHTISATFALMSYTITVNAGANGTITPGTANYGYGATPTFAITPAEGYVISDVTVDGASVGAVPTYTFTALTADHTIAATFAAAHFSITATAGNGGTITPAGVTNMAYNGNQTYTIAANSGYHVSDVFVDGASVGAVTTYTFSGVTANHTIYAAFEANEYTVTVNQPANGHITPGTTTVMFGATPAFVITPNPGYNVTAITVNGSNVISSATNVNGVYTYTFPAINANQTITATMAIKTYTITASAGANGTISPNGNTTVNHGATQAYAFNPANGYVVDNVTVDGMSFGALTAYTFTNVVANHTINVTFKLAECEVPTFMYTSHIDSTSAELHWSHPTATSFDIQYKTPTGTLTSVSNVSGNSYLLTNLTPNTTYLWQVRANCAANNHSDWSNLVTFKTDNTLDISGIEDFVKSHVQVYAEHQNVHILNNEGMNIENVRILDAYGRLVYTGSVSSSHEVIGLNVAAGTYIVNVTTDKGVANYKVTILK